MSGKGNKILTSSGLVSPSSSHLQLYRAISDVNSFLVYWTPCISHITNSTEYKSEQLSIL